MLFNAKWSNGQIIHHTLKNEMFPLYYSYVAEILAPRTYSINTMSLGSFLFCD